MRPGLGPKPKTTQTELVLGTTNWVETRTTVCPVNAGIHDHRVRVETLDLPIGPGLCNQGQNRGPLGSEISKWPKFNIRHQSIMDLYKFICKVLKKYKKLIEIKTKMVTKIRELADKDGQ